MKIELSKQEIEDLINVIDMDSIALKAIEDETKDGEKMHPYYSNRYKEEIDSLKRARKEIYQKLNKSLEGA